MGYICDSEKAKANKARLDAIHTVTLTIRQDLIAGCRFLRDAEAGYETEARIETVDTGGNVFYIGSDIGRTETKRDEERGEFRSYEVRHLVGKVYACEYPR